MIRDIDIDRTFCLSSTLHFTRYMFKHKMGKKFVIGQHHRQICSVLDRVIKGEIRRLIINIAPRYGKAIDINTPMLTTKGWKKAGDVQVGDCLFGRNGFPTKVVATYPQGVTDAYRVNFSDGSNLITCGNHLWSLNHKDLSRKDDFTFKEIRRTKDLIGTLRANDGHKMWHIPMCDPIKLDDDKFLPVDPYLLGCWLGDGSSVQAEITTMDEEIIRSFSDYNPSVRKCQNSRKAITYGLRCGFVTKLKALGVLKNKHIPMDYILSSENQRFALLQGLCDTDGTCNKKTGQTSYCSTNEQLLSDVKLLLSSLGIFYTEYRHNLYFRSDKCPFTLERKKKLWRPPNKRHYTKRFIDSIERVTDRETICFTVDAKDHLYAAGKDLIVTHNTELVSKNFISYGFAINPKSKFIHLSYSDDLVLDNSKEINETVQSEYYQRLFPEVKALSTNAKKWYTSAGGGMYAVSAAGQVTGFGAGQVDDPDKEKAEMGEFIPIWESDFAGAIIIDDPIKPEDALSETVRERVNNRFETTIRNRVNSRSTPIIIIMQRLHEHDLCGYLQELEGNEWTVLSLPCIQYDESGNEKALWEFKHNLEELHKIEKANSFVFGTQYMQDPKPLEGLMYKEFKTYEIIPYATSMVRKNYTDSADTGSDFLCSICYTETPIGNFVTDVLYTQKSMEYTEPATAEMLGRNTTQVCYIESNNGGRAFGRNVEAQCRIMGNNSTSFTSFTQTNNKKVRIFTRSNEVQNLTYFPAGWERRWPEFASHIKSYRKQQEFNSHDDAEDVLTGMVEKRGYYDSSDDNDDNYGIW